jgi:hypothetical protein
VVVPLPDAEGRHARWALALLGLTSVGDGHSCGRSARRGGRARTRASHRAGFRDGCLATAGHTRPGFRTETQPSGTAAMPRLGRSRRLGVGRRSEQGHADDGPAAVASHSCDEASLRASVRGGRAGAETPRSDNVVFAGSGSNEPRSVVCAVHRPGWLWGAALWTTTSPGLSATHALSAVSGRSRGIGAEGHRRALGASRASGGSALQ